MENLNQIRKDHSKCPQFSSDNTHEAVITKTFTAKNKFQHYGVQYWTPGEIATGLRATGLGYSIFVDKLVGTEFTPDELDAALKSNAFMNNDSREAKIVQIATKMGYVFRASHTQAHWTDEGVLWSQTVK